MSHSFGWPAVVFSSDIDWASDPCIEDTYAFACQFGIKPCFFVTHESAALARLARADQVELAVHPNFLPRSSHGNSPEEVIDHVMALVPEAQGFRAHCFFDSTPVTRTFRSRGLIWDSNLCLHLHEGIVPLRHCSGLVRLPVFWADDVHMTLNPDQWSVDTIIEHFLSPGLKILDVHPIHLALNAPHLKFYEEHRDQAKALTSTDIERIRYDGPGARTFLRDLLFRLRNADVRSYTFAEIVGLLSDDKTAERDFGRNDRLTAEDHKRYWSIGSKERQAVLRNIYNKRAATDPYATSRDHNLRELEIAAIKASLAPTPRIIDLGCGNGYTLLSLGKVVEDCRLIGVDFADKLIEGAIRQTEEMGSGLKCVPEFICEDAIEFVKKCDDASSHCVITERFLLNLPDEKTQRSVIKDIFRILKPGGQLLMCEGSLDGFRALNDLRRSVALEEIAATSADNVSSNRFDDKSIERFITEDVGFLLAAKLGFSLFFAVSRVLYPALIAPQRPSFGARINELARSIQQQSPFAPGLGSNVLWVLEKPRDPG